MSSDPEFSFVSIGAGDSYSESESEVSAESAEFTWYGPKETHEDPGKGFSVVKK